MPYLLSKEVSLVGLSGEVKEGLLFTDFSNVAGRRIFGYSDYYGCRLLDLRIREDCTSTGETFLVLSAVYEKSTVDLCRASLFSPGSECLTLDGFVFYAEVFSGFCYNDSFLDAEERAFSGLLCAFWQVLNVCRVGFPDVYFCSDVVVPSALPELDLTILSSTGFFRGREDRVLNDSSAFLYKFKFLKEALEKKDFSEFCRNSCSLVDLGIAVVWNKDGDLELRNYRDRASLLQRRTTPSGYWAFSLSSDGWGSGEGR